MSLGSGLICRATDRAVWERPRCNVDATAYAFHVSPRFQAFSHLVEHTLSCYEGGTFPAMGFAVPSAAISPARIFFPSSFTCCWILR
jgi:hypothetical protein